MFASKITGKITGFQAHSQNCENRLLASSCLSVRMEQLGSHRVDFRGVFENVAK
jgi:hypothetical protein